MLHLPYVTQLVGDEIVLLGSDHRAPQEDRKVRGVAVEACETTEGGRAAAVMTRTRAIRTGRG